MLAHKPLRDRVRDGLPNAESDEFAIKYLEIVWQNSKDAHIALRRTTLLLVLLAVLFQLLTSAGVAEVTLGPVKLRDVPSVSAIVAGLFAHLFYEQWILIDAASNFRNLSSQVVRRVRPVAWQNDLDIPLSPAVVSLWGADAWTVVRATSPNKLSAFRHRTDFVFAMGTYLIGFAFLVYAYWTLLEDPAPAVWISLSFAIFSATRFIVAFVEDFLTDETALADTPSADSEEDGPVDQARASDGH